MMDIEGLEKMKSIIWDRVTKASCSVETHEFLAQHEILSVIGTIIVGK